MSEDLGTFRVERLIGDEEIGHRIHMQVCALQPEVYLPQERAANLRLPPVVLSFLTSLPVDRCEVTIYVRPGVGNHPARRSP